MVRENEQASSYSSTTYCGIHHGQIVVLAGSEIFCSSFTPRA